MNFLNWLKMGMAFFLAFNEPQVYITPTQVTISVSLQNLFTSEMLELLNHGVEFEFKIYSSIIAIDKEGKKTLFKTAGYKKISYNYQSNLYFLEQDNLLIWQDSDLNKIMQKTKDFKFNFALNAAFYSKLSFYCEISLADNQLVKDRLGLDINALWKNYKPVLEYDFNSLGKKIE